MMMRHKIMIRNIGMMIERNRRKREIEKEMKVGDIRIGKQKKKEVVPTVSVKLYKY